MYERRLLPLITSALLLAPLGCGDDDPRHVWMVWSGVTGYEPGVAARAVRLPTGPSTHVVYPVA